LPIERAQWAGADAHTAHPGAELLFWGFIGIPGTILRFFPEMQKAVRQCTVQQAKNNTNLLTIP
jgi:hypothetical protein